MKKIIFAASLFAVFAIGALISSDIMAAEAEKNAPPAVDTGVINSPSAGTSGKKPAAGKTGTSGNKPTAGKTGTSAKKPAAGKTGTSAKKPATGSKPSSGTTGSKK